jgi:protein O-GlcNAc transferase
VTEPEEEVRRLIARGNELEDAGQFEQARVQYEDAARIAPGQPRPLLNLGNALRGQGRLVDAIAATRRAIAVAPAFAPGHFNLGLLLRQSGDLDAAEQALCNAIAFDHAFTDAAVALADLLAQRGRTDDACRELERAVDANPARAAAAYNLALLRIERDELDAAEWLLHRAVRAEPGFAPTYAALGNVCFRSRRAKEAEAWYRETLARDPGASDAATALLFSLTARDDLTAQQVYALHRELADRLERGIPQAPLPAHAVRPRLRIGYLSPDFRAHAVALFIRPVLRHHDRSAFEVFCYDCGRDENALTAMFRGLAEHWRNIADLSDAEAAALIRRDELDVLVDLAGYTRGSRVLLFARRCAPVQASWLGYLHSTGLASADVRICDRHTDPPGVTESLHSERLARLPHSLWCYDAMHKTDATGPTHVPSERVVFGSFNQFWKISDASVALWLSILRQVPDARLVVIGVPAGTVMDAFREQLQQGGLGGGRVTLLPRLDIEGYFQAIGDVDIALDTLPYNGATTTLDALASGVPVVALTGDRSVARSGTSILRTLGMPELVAADPGEYVSINVRLARDRPWRERLRRALPEALARSPLMDAPGFTRDLEALYRRLAGR